jgi:hypothetical protein
MADKYAGMLTEDDVENLFSLLAKELGGNRSEAARQCGLTLKATYDWEGTAYVKLGTKRKVLEASLRMNFIAASEYLLERSSDRNFDLLRTVLGTFYANALEATSQGSFGDNLERFETMRIRHRGLIRDGIQNEVTDMAISLRAKAEELGLPPKPKTTNDLSAEDMINAMQLIGRIYVENPLQAETLAVKDIGLPADAVKPIIATFQNMCFTREMQTNTMSDFLVRAKPRAASAERAPLPRLYLSFAPKEDAWVKQIAGRSTEGGIATEVTTSA